MTTNESSSPTSISPQQGPYITYSNPRAVSDVSPGVAEQHFPPENARSNESTVAEEWWRDGKFKQRLIANWLNGLLKQECERIQEVFERHVQPATNMDVAHAVRRDAVSMTRWDVMRDAAMEGAGEAYGTARGLLGPLLALVVGGFIASRGLIQFEIILVAAAITFLVILTVLDASSLSSKVQSTLVLVWIGAGITVLVMLILLVLHPAHGLGVDAAFGIVLGSLGLVVLTVPVSHRIIAHFDRLLPGAIELAVLAVTAIVWHYVMVRHLGSTGWPDWILRGLRAGAISWFYTTLALVIINTASIAFSAFLQFRKLRKAPEAEFVQSALLAMFYVEEAMKSDGAKSDRGQAVSVMEYLATVLDTNVCVALAREDPRSCALVAENLRQRAEAIRIDKSNLLFGRPKAYSKAVHALANAVVYGAHRNWLALPVASSENSPRVSRARRFTRIVSQIAMVAIPVALGLIAWKIGQKGLIPFAVLWAVVSLLELMRPGSGSELAKSASDANAILPGSDMSKVLKRGT